MKNARRCKTCKGNGGIIETDKGAIRKVKCPAGCTSGYMPAKGFRFAPCPGEAHKSAAGGNIDNCMTCAPLWGWVLVTAT